MGSLCPRLHGPRACFPGAGSALCCFAATPPPPPHQTLIAQELKLDLKERPLKVIKFNSFDFHLWLLTLRLEEMTGSRSYSGLGLESLGLLGPWPWRTFVPPVMEHSCHHHAHSPLQPVSQGGLPGPLLQVEKPEVGVQGSTSCRSVPGEDTQGNGPAAVSSFRALGTGVSLRLLH